MPKKNRERKIQDGKCVSEESKTDLEAVVARLTKQSENVQAQIDRATARKAEIQADIDELNALIAQLPDDPA